MAAGQDVLAQRKVLWTELRHERRVARLTQKEVARAMDWSPSKVFRIETGAVGISTTDLRALLSFYNIKDERQTEELVDLARAARSRKGAS
jgi:transcriptional regulator with XRE-family HTH domain